MALPKGTYKGFRKIETSQMYPKIFMAKSGLVNKAHWARKRFKLKLRELVNFLMDIMQFSLLI